MIEHIVKKSNPEGERSHLNKILKDLDEVIAAIASGAGLVDSVVAGPGIVVDASDPANPEVGLTAGSLAAITLANSSIQPGDNVSSLVNDAGYITGGVSASFETVSKNLEAGNAVLAYSLGKLDTITYTVAAGTIVKTFNYTGDQLTSIVLSGDTPGGIDLTKTLSYTGDSLTGASYT